MDVKTLIDEANAYADKAIKKSQADGLIKSVKQWLNEPVTVYRLHLAIMTSLLAAFVIYEVIIY
jgi:hypothetical protein